MEIRPAAPSDNAAIAAIWNREVLQTAATSDTEPRDPEAQPAWLAAHGPPHPVIVAKDGWRGKGLGGRILDRLLLLAREHGHRSVIARVTAANEASLALHERRGFVRVGHEHQVALKHGMWLDVVTLQRILSA
jgi:L-amino acid N-acyltransferase YncA